MIKIVIFDFGGVLGSDANNWEINFKEILDRTNLSVEEIDQIWKRHWPEMSVGKEGLNDLLDDISVSSKNKIDVGVLRKIYYENVSLDEHILKLALRLKQQGMRLVIVANESREGMDNKTKRFSLEKVFDNIYCSAVVGLTKPNPAMFSYVMRDLCAKPEQVVFIDNRQGNVDAANKLGIKSILFKNVNQLEDDLKKVIQ